MRHLAFAVAVAALVASSASAHGGRGHHRDCARSLNNRTADQVLDDHRAALAAGDWDAVGCNYAEDAVVISDQGTISGREDIVAALQGLSGFLGGAIPMVVEEVIVSILNDRAEMGRVLFSVTTPCVDIPDGADTYIIKNGKIQAQTAHGLPVFKCAPPGP